MCYTELTTFYKIVSHTRIYFELVAGFHTNVLSQTKFCIF